MKRKILSMLLCLALLASFFTAFNTPVMASDPASSLIVNILNPDGTTTLVHEYTGTPVYDNGVIVYYTYPELESISGITYYATIDAMPAAVGTKAWGVTISDLVYDAQQYNPNITWSSGQKFVLYPTDGYGYPYQGNNFYTYDFVQGQSRYYYPNLVEKYTAYRSSGDPADLTGWDANPEAVEPVLCLSSYQARYATDADLHNNPTLSATESFRFCMGLTPTEASNGVAGTYSSTNKFCKWTYRIDFGPVNGPSLAADTTNNSLGQPIDITFTDNSVWRSAITGITVDSVTVNPAHYTVSAGNITFDSTVFTTTGNHAVVVAASGFMNANVTQQVGVPPTLTADTTNTVIGQAVDITFTDNPYWRAAVSSVTVNDSPITNYTLTAGNLNIPAVDFSTPGDYTIQVSATGYANSSVIQPMAPAPACTVTFDSQGGSAVSSQSVAYGGLVNVPAAPTKSGYGFSGWYKESACVTAWNFASDTVTGDITLYANWTIDFAYTTSGTDATITGYTGSGGVVVIPENVTIGGYTYTVTALADGTSSNYVFKDVKATLTSVTIPDSLTSIGAYAFYQCTNLTSISMGDNVTSIGARAFYKAGLTALSLPVNASLGDYAFYQCTGLVSLNIPAGMTLGKATFSGCSGLTTLTLEDGLTSIEESVFYNCSGLTAVNIPNSVSVIGKNAFNGCSGLESLNIPSSVTGIGDTAFRSCTGLTTVTLPNGLLTIGTGAFRECSSLTSIVIPDSVTSLGTDVFNGCSALTAVTLSNGLTTIESTSFKNCTVLTTIEIPAGVVAVNANAFNGCNSLNSAYFPGAQPTFGSAVFTGTDSGFTVYYHVSQSASWSTFSTYPKSAYCSLTLNLQDGTMPSGSYAAVDSNGHIAAPADPVRSGFIFAGWYKEAACVNIFNFSTETVTDDINLYAKWLCYWEYAIVGDHSIIGDYSGPSGDVVVPDAFEVNGIAYPLTVIFDDCFRGMSYITALTLPDSLTTINCSAFFNCTGLTSITIPGNVTSIGAYAFGNCAGLSSITIPDSVTLISQYAFSGCSNLNSAYFLGTVPTFGSNVFQSCAAGFTVYYHVIQSAGWSTFGSYPKSAFCTLTLDLQDGTTPSGSYVAVDINGHIAAPADPVRNGFIFGGWYKEEACVNIFNFSIETVNDDLTLYAQWFPYWDLNGDHICDEGDLQLVSDHWGETGPAGWIPEDLNYDGVIDVCDMVVLGSHWEETW
jgi:uncharacterized repeat protein (TIGR02543 family)